MLIPSEEKEPLSRLVVELEIDKAEAFATNNLNEDPSQGIPPSMIVIGEQKERLKILPFDLPDFTDPPSFWVAMTRERLCEIGKLVGKRRNFQPVCIISMIELHGMTHESWASEMQERSAEMADPTYGSAIAITAANAEGYQIRRLCQLQNCDAPRAEERRVVDTIDVRSLGEASEMDEFWQTFKAARRKTPGQGFGQLRVN